MIFLVYVILSLTVAYARPAQELFEAHTSSNDTIFQIWNDTAPLLPNLPLTNATNLGARSVSLENQQ